MLFGNLNPRLAADIDNIEIEQSKLKEDGEVPSQWLKQFDLSRTWSDIKFSCRCPCKKSFDNFGDLQVHQQTLSNRDKGADCSLCSKRFSSYYSSSLLNHMARSHLDFVRFCCVVCSKVFYNMPFLSQHYRQCHPNQEFKLFPCLQCGFYGQSMANLVAHLKTHEKKNIE